MDPVLMQLRFVLAGDSSILSVEEWTDCLEKTTKKLVSAPHDSTKIGFLCTGLIQLLVPCSKDRSLGPEVAQLCNLPSLIPLLCRRLAGGSSSAAMCLASVMQVFPGACGNLKDSIEKALLQSLDVESVTEEFSSSCADCWSLFPFIGGSGVNHGHHKANWQKLASASVGTLHEVLTELFRYVPGAVIASPGDEIPRLELGKVPLTNHSNFVSGLVWRYTHVTEYLISMMTVDSPVPVDLPLPLVLLVIERALSVGGSMLTAANEAPSQGKNRKNALKRSIFVRFVAKVLPRIYHSALRLLRSLILCCGGVPLYEYGRAIGRLLANAMEWTAETGVEKRFDEAWRPSENDLQEARKEAYACLEEWIEASKGVAFPKASTGADAPLSRIWRSAWADFVGPSGYSTKPTAAPSSGTSVDERVVELWGLSKKEKKQRKRKMAMDPEAGGKKRLKARATETVSFRDLEQSDIIAAEIFLMSCKCVKVLVQFCGQRLSSDVYSSKMNSQHLLLLGHTQTLSETVASLLSWDEVEDTKGRSLIGLLYRHPDCREALYDLLVCQASSWSTLDQWPLPTSVVISLLSRGSSDSDPNVSGLCARALKIFATATMRPPGLTLEWRRRAPAVAAEEVERADFRSSKKILMEEDSVQLVEIDSIDPIDEESPRLPQKVSEKARRAEKMAERKSKKKSLKKEKPEVVSLDDDDEEASILIDDDIVEVSSPKVLRPSKKENRQTAEVPAISKRTESVEASSKQEPAKETVQRETSEPVDDLPPILDMLAAFTDG